MKVVCFYFLVLATCSAALAQLATNGAAISGVVLDPENRPVPNASVTIQNTDWSQKRSSVTNATGEFSQAGFSAGTYAIQATAPGFALAGKPTRVVLNSGASARLTLRLKIAAKTEKVTVAGSVPTSEGNSLPPAIDKDSAVESNVVAGLNVTYLPVRNRDLLQFGQLAAAATHDSQNGLVIDGQRPEYTRTIVDGAQWNDASRGNATGAGSTGLAFPQTAVRDFQVIEAGGAADIGGTNGPMVKVATKSGTNKFRGEGFYIGRPSGLTSDDAFGHALANSQNQFGGSVGGPVVKNRIFYYLGGEQDYLNNPAWTQFQPQPTGTAIPASLSSQQVQTVGKTASTLLFGRLDFLLPHNQSLDLQTNYARLDASNAGYGSTRIDASPSFGERVRGHDTWIRANLTGVYGANVVNQALVQWSGNHRSIDPMSAAPQIDIDGFGTLGGNATDPSLYSADREQVSDDVAVTNGRTTIHAGAEYLHAPFRLQRQTNLNGLFTFASLDQFLAGIPTRFQQTFRTGDPSFGGSIETFGVYVTAKQQLAPQLTITAGLRWDGQWNPSGTTTIPNDLLQFQPRVGIAWSASSRTTLRASAGIYDAASPAMLFQRAFVDNGSSSITVDSYFDPSLLALASAPGWHSLSAPPPGLTTTRAQIFGIEDSFRNPRSLQTAASVEQELRRDTSVSVGYLRQSTWGLPVWSDTNLLAPSLDAVGLPLFPSTRPEAGVGQKLTARSAAHSSYDAMTVKFKMQLPKRSNLSANYTLASSRDNEASFDPFAINSTLDPFDLSIDAAPSNFDVRHTVNVSAVFNLPLGLKCNPMLLARSGAPYTPVVGIDLQNDANDWNDRAIVNGRVAERNSMRQPAFVNLDLRFVKDFTLRGEGHHLDLFLDVFNITNAANRNFGPSSLSEFGVGNSFLGAGVPLYAPDSTRFGGARQVQFTARIVAF